MPLGERINIPRSNLNGVEIIAIMASAALGVVTLRTVFGLWTRDKRAWTWAQWVVLLTAIVGLTIFLNGSFDVHQILPIGGSVIDNLPGVQELTGTGLLVFLSCLAVYRFLTVSVDTPPDAVIRNTLAKSPSAGAIIGFFAIGIIFALGSDLFLEQRSLAGLLATNITRGIVAIGATFLMISGEFDLSVGSVFGAGALVFLLMMTEGFLGITTTVIPAAIIALIFSAILGMINGLILVWTGIPSFIITLGTLLMYRAILLVVVADGRILRYADYRLPPPFVYFNYWLLAAGALIIAVVVAIVGFPLVRNAWNTLRERYAKYSTDANDLRDFWLVWAVIRLVGLSGFFAVLILFLGVFAINQVNASSTSSMLELDFFTLANGRFDFVAETVNLRIGVLWWFLLVAGFQFILTQTRYGNHVFAVGGNPGAARAQGINVNRVKVTNFMISSMLACTAGIISVARLANVDPLMGDGLELEVIAASVIGGALLSGGYGSIFGSLLGVLIFGMLQTGLVLVNVDARAFSGVIGFIIIVAVVINTVVRRAKT
jgi:ribose/xylose/arabinose/galactoside ABC-type transport system permease subunit